MRVLRAIEAIGRDPTGFDVAGQVVAGATGDDRRSAVAAASALVAAGATHVIVGMPARLGPTGSRMVAREVAEPLRAAIG